MIQEKLQDIHDRIEAQYKILVDIDNFSLHYTDIGKQYRLRMLRGELNVMMGELKKIMEELR